MSTTHLKSVYIFKKLCYNIFDDYGRPPKGELIMKIHTVDICGFKAEMPIMTLPSGVGIAFFNLHGDSTLTEHCGKELAKRLTDCEVLITAESKGLQLTH